MNRRQALKAALATSINGMLAMKAFPIVDGSMKFIVLYNPKLFGQKAVKDFLSDYPGSTAYPIDGNMDDAARIFHG